MPTPLRLLLTCGLCTALLCGCQSASSQPPAAPSATALCTPDVGGDGYACSEADHTAMKRRHALYAEAEAVYRRFFAEDVRLLLSGGVLEPTVVLTDTASGPFLADVMAAQVRQQTRGISFVGGDVRLMWVRPNPGVAKGASEVSLVTCRDATSTAAYQGGRLIEHGNAGVDVLYFVRIDGALKIWGADGRKVSSCDAA